MLPPPVNMPPQMHGTTPSDDDVENPLNQQTAP
jgi:hypothetical protein